MEDSVSEDVGPWYSQKIYARYWKHYSQAMQWMHRHKMAYRKAMETFYHHSIFPSSHPSQRYSDWDEGNSSREAHYSAYSQSSSPWPQLPLRGKDTGLDRYSKTENESDDEEAIEYDLSNMEITEELRQYFEQTEKHREELRKQQQLEAEHDTYVEADHDLHPSVGRSGQPPPEKPGERRLAEMKKLYGEGASKIQAMETTMQLSFDRNCDKKQPKYWPIIPLKL
ncbi:gem-associated protein 8 isoform X2 [Paroedura picta]